MTESKQPNDSQNASSKSDSQELSEQMTPEAFDKRYWYVDQLKVFADQIGIPQAFKFRKDELETHIRHYLQTGQVPQILPKRMQAQQAAKDSDYDITSDTVVVNFTNDQKTKQFIDNEAKRRAPELKKKSGDRYWLNRWREEQIEQGKTITYGDLVDHLIELRQQPGRLPPIPSTKFNNFVSEYLAANPDASRETAIHAWQQLKKWPVEKTYQAYVDYINTDKKR